MRTKLFAVLFALIMLLIFLTGCSQKKDETPTAESIYNDAISLLQQGKYTEAAVEFADLGHYYDASRYAVYCNALVSAEKGDYSLAASSMKALEGFLDSSILNVYYTGRAYEEDEKYEKALVQYSSILQYGDAGARAIDMPGKAKERDYKAACALEQAESYQSAIAAFEALKGYSDSEEHIASIRQILAERENAKAYADADAMEKAGKLEEAADAFRALGDYSDSKERVTAIEGKIRERDYQKALALEQDDDLVSAYALYTGLGDYQEAKARAEAIREEATYRSAFAMADEGQYGKARESYLELGEYKDSAEKARLLGVCELASSARNLNSGIVAFQLQDSWGYIDLNNNYDVAPAYDNIAPFSAKTDLAVVSVNSGDTEYFGLINRQGAVVAADAYLGIMEGENGYYTAVKKGRNYDYKFVLINPQGTALSEWLSIGNSVNEDVTSRWNQYSLKAPSFTNGVIIAMDSNNEYSLINDEGKAVIRGAKSIELIRRMKASDTALVNWKKSEYQLMNLDGTPLDDNLWSAVSEFKEGYAAVQTKDKLWGYVSEEDCHIAIEPQYQDADSFSGGYAGVKVDKVWGYIDAQNKMVIDPRYNLVTGFSNGRAMVYDGTVGWKVIDETGKLLYFKQNSYLAADSLDKAGEYEQAIAAFESLGGYADSGERALQARDKVNASIYASAEKLEVEGKYIEAAETFEWLGGYSDAADRAKAARETQNAVTYASAEELEKNGQLEEAISIYLTLGEYNNSAQHAADLRESINQGICRQADELESGEKFEAAIEVLKQIPDYTGVAEHITALEEKIRVRDYNAAAALEEAGQFEEAIEAFTAMGDYSDSAERIVTIQGKIRDRDYNAAAALEEARKFEEAIEAFTAMGDYSDSAERIETIRGKIKDRDYNAAASLEEAGKFEEAIEAFAAMGDYSDSKERITTIRGKIKERDYNAAAALEEAGNYTDAYEAFIRLGEYSDSATRATGVLEKAEEQKRQNAYTAAAEAEEKGELETAASGFEALGEYNDAPARLAGVQEKIRQRDYKEAVDALNNEDYVKAAELFTALGDYQDSAELLAQAQIGAKYQKALSDALTGNLADAYNQFVELGEYKDSAKKAEICGNLSRASKTQEITKGVLIYDFHELWGIANLNTNVITAAKYTLITYDGDSNYAKYGLLNVYLENEDSTKNAYGYIDHNGKEIIPCSYISITDFNADGNCTVAKWAGEKKSWSSALYHRFMFGIMDYTGKTISSVTWRTMGASKNKNWNDDRYSVYLDYCQIQLPDFTDGRMKVQNADGYWGFINKQGKILGEIKWSDIGDFSDGMAMVCEAVSTGKYDREYKYGFINEEGKTIGEVRWDEVNAFSNGLAAVREGNYWGFINKSNELVIDCNYVEVSSFKEDGTCDVKTKDGTWQVINTKGEVSFF